MPLSSRWWKTNGAAAVGCPKNDTCDTVQSRHDPDPVPGPIAGAGLPGLILALVAKIGSRTFRHLGGSQAMGNLLFWLGIGAAQKGAGSKPIERHGYLSREQRRHAD